VSSQAARSCCTRTAPPCSPKHVSLSLSLSQWLEPPRCPPVSCRAPSNGRLPESVTQTEVPLRVELQCFAKARRANRLRASAGSWGGLAESSVCWALHPEFQSACMQNGNSSPEIVKVSSGAAPIPLREPEFAQNRLLSQMDMHLWTCTGQLGVRAWPFCALWRPLVRTGLRWRLVYLFIYPSPSLTFPPNSSSFTDRSLRPTDTRRAINFN